MHNAFGFQAHQQMQCDLCVIHNACVASWAVWCLMMLFSCSPRSGRIFILPLFPWHEIATQPPSSAFHNFYWDTGIRIKTNQSKLHHLTSRPLMVPQLWGWGGRCPWALYPRSARRRDLSLKTLNGSNPRDSVLRCQLLTLRQKQPVDDCHPQPSVTVAHWNPNYSHLVTLNDGDWIADKLLFWERGVSF